VEVKEKILLTMICDSRFRVYASLLTTINVLFYGYITVMFFLPLGGVSAEVG
jgi:hypothetical protein